MRPSFPSWLGRAGRLIRGLVLAALALEALYLVAINVFLSTSLFDKVVNAKPLDVDIHYARGWSLFPSRIHAKKLSIRGTDSHLEWMLRLDDAEFECSLLQLVKKEFHVTSVRGSGISFRLRLKVASPAATAAALAELPTISSLGQVGFLPDEAPNERERWNDHDWHLWTVRIDGAIAQHVREVWIQDARFTGDADIDGGFYLKPIRAVEISPATVAVREGTLRLDSKVAADQLSATIHGALAKFDPRVTEGVDLLDRVSLTADARAEIPNVGDLGVALPESYAVAGRVSLPRLAVRVRNGRLQDGTHLDATSSTLTMVGPSLGADANGFALTANVADDRLLAKVSIERIDTSLAATANQLTVVMDSADLGASDPLGDLHASVDLPGVDVPKIAPLARELLHAPNVEVLGGSLHGSARAELWRKEKRLRGDAALQGTALDAAVGALRFRGDVKALASVGAVQWDALQATHAEAKVEVPQGSLARKAAPEAPFLHVTGLRLEGDAEHVDLEHPEQAFHATLALPNGEILDPDSVRAAMGLKAAVYLGSRRAAFASSAELAVDGPSARGKLEASLPALELDAAGKRLRLAATATLQAHTSDWHAGTFAVDRARVVARGLELAEAGSSPAATVASISATATSGAFRLQNPLADLRVTAAIDGARVSDGAILGALLPHEIKAAVSGRAATLSAQLAGAVTNGIVQGTASVVAENVGITSPKVHVAGNVRATAAVRRWALKEKTVRGAASLELTGVQGGFAPEARTPEFVASEISLSASANDLNLAQPSLQHVGYAVRVAGAELEDARTLNVLLPSSEILAIDSGHATVSLEVTAQPDEPGARGHAEVKLTHAGLILGETHFGGDFALALHASDPKGDGTGIDLEGSQLEMRNVQVKGTSTNTAGWAGALTVESGQLRLSPAPRLEAELVLRARDANPILGVLFRDSLPKFVADWTHMPHFSALTHVVVEPRQLVISELMASGGDLSVRGTYALRGARRSGGAFVVEKGPWSAGVDVNAAGAHLRLFGLDGWYKQRAAQITRAD